MRSHASDQLYTRIEVARLLRVPPKRFMKLVRSGEALGPDVLVPGAGHKAARWSATRVDQIKQAWLHPAAA
jgi:hypothetical protein